MQPKSYGKMRYVSDDGGPVLFSFPRGVEIQSQHLYGWFPRPQTSQAFPEGSGVPMVCLTDSKGRRRFTPFGRSNRKTKQITRYAGAGQFFMAAHLCGLPILIDSHRLEREDRQSYRAMWFLFQKSQRMQQFIRRQFRTTKDLSILDKTIRERERRRHILPWPTDERARKLGYPSNVESLLDVGECEAKRIGVRQPNIAQRIHYGFVAAARLEEHPVLSTAKSRELIKHVLFDIDPRRPDGLSHEVEMSIRTKIKDCLYQLVDAPTEMTEFNEAFWEKSNTFVKKVAGSVPDLPQGDSLGWIGRVLLEMGFEAYQYLAQCIHAVMREVPDGVDPPLSVEERRAFELLYYPQDFTGGLPLVLLAERLEFVEGVVHGLINAEDQAREIQSFHRMLSFYQCLIDSRHEVDSQSKWHEEHRGEEFLEDRYGDVPESDPFENERIKLYARLTRIREKRGVTCGCESPQWAIPEIEKSTTKHAFVVYKCDFCGYQKEIKVPLAKLRLGRP